MNKFTQDEFDKEHREPKEYGEVDYYVVADSYTEEEAAAVISKWESDLSGEDREYTADDISSVSIVVGKNEDGEDDWCTYNGATRKEIVARGKAVAL